MAKIWTNQTAVADYQRIQGGTTALSYHAGVDLQNAVCVAMPPRPEPYVPLAASGTRGNQLLPFFAMSLPEGGFRQTLDKLFRQRLPDYDEMTLLEIVGHSTIGRVRVLRDTTETPPLPPTLDVADLLEQRGGRELFDDLFTRFSHSAGVSGAQPKLLVRNKISDSKVAAHLTVKDATHILKTFDSREYPHLAANEYLCLLVAKEAGLPVPDVRLASDGALLAVERFDLRADGTFLGFEDACSLALLYPEQKYSGSYEQVAKTLSAHLAQNPARLLDGMANLFKNLVLSVVLRNGDAHRKNFGILYDSPASADCFLAPAYDIVTTACYIKDDTLALTLDGSKRWPSRKSLVRFGAERCFLSSRDAADIIEQVCDATASIRRKAEAGEFPLPPESAPVLKAMFAEWENGTR